MLYDTRNSVKEFRVFFIVLIYLIYILLVDY